MRANQPDKVHKRLDPNLRYRLKTVAQFRRFRANAGIDLKPVADGSFAANLMNYSIEVALAVVNSGCELVTIYGKHRWVHRSEVQVL